MLNQHYDDTPADRSKSLPFIHRHYLLLKAHYFLSYASFGALGPILNITLRSRGLSDIQISSINLVIPFLVFFTNPLIGFIADYTRRFRLTFNIILCLATVSLITMFSLPPIKSHQIQGELQQNGASEYSLIFCANKRFTTECVSRTPSGCTYQASCARSSINKNKSYEGVPMEMFVFNLTVNSMHIVKEHKNVQIHRREHSVCSINYHVSIDPTMIERFQVEIKGNDNYFPRIQCASVESVTNFALFLDSSGDGDRLSLKNNSKVATCEIKCSPTHLCQESQYSQQIFYVLLYSVLIVLGLNLIANASAIGASIGFATLHRSNLFGRQRVWGTIGCGLSAFIASRFYAYFRTDYIYICIFVVASILSILVTSFIRIRSGNCQQDKQNHDDISVREKLNECPINKKQKEIKSQSFKIRTLLPLLQKTDVIMLLLTSLLWGISTGAIDPYLLLYIDEISPGESRSIAGYISLIMSTFEVIAFFVSNKVIQSLGTQNSSILIFIAFAIRFSGYYLIRHPYFLLFMETMHFFNFGILFVLIAQESLAIAPSDLSGTLQGIVYGIYFGLGRGIGLLISLLIYTQMEKRRLFLIYAIFNMVSVLIYAVYCLSSKGKSSSSVGTSNTNIDHMSKSISIEFGKTSHAESSLLSSSSIQIKNEMEVIEKSFFET